MYINNIEKKPRNIPRINQHPPIINNITITPDSDVWYYDDINNIYEGKVTAIIKKDNPKDNLFIFESSKLP